ncbi:hypothetical protein FRX31_021786 [Thalictrum thalictroides]|uniref:Uncharacterized protein n=1 Tax=Thalictrum thalictroides TaxID=46969 RepID=A0A7J6VWB8_THATH|nr:hypothetical protein FRX31_021786 [Thalictrum thalictroides]
MRNPWHIFDDPGDFSGFEKMWREALKRSCGELISGIFYRAQSRRSRSPSPFVQPAASFVVFRPDVVFILLRRVHKDSHLGIVCRTASRILEKLVEPGLSLDAPTLDGDPTVVFKPGSACNETAKVEASNHMLLADYSVLFGEEFTVSDDQWDSNYVNVLDVGAVEEGIFHVLYACASHVSYSFHRSSM